MARGGGESAYKREAGWRTPQGALGWLVTMPWNQIHAPRTTDDLGTNVMKLSIRWH